MNLLLVNTRRHFHIGVTQSVLLYDAKAYVLDKKPHRKRLAQAQRWGALRVTFADRTISEPIVMVVAGVISVTLFAKEHKAIYIVKAED